ncbi:MAG: adenylyltransferase/cytidyltransferase family protein [Candidatus Aenigmatarchaeota archaeon]
MARLQPFHNGHLHAIKKILEKYNSVLIAIGSSQASRERNNPFSFDERKAMLKNVLKGEGIFEKCEIVGIPDVNNDEEWLRLVEKYDFDVAVTGNAWTRRCLEKKYPVFEPAFLEPEKYNSTSIRNAIRKHDAWSDLVPKQVFDFVTEKIDSGEVLISGQAERKREW